MKIIYIKKKKSIYNIGSYSGYNSFILVVLYSKMSKPVCYVPMINKTVGIDPGHGGVDPGAIGITGGVREDEINLKVGGLKLKKSLLNRVEVWLL